MSKTIYLQAYFNTLQSFFEDMMRAFPNDADIPAYKVSVNMLQRTNPMMVVTSMLETIAPYEKMIETRDVDFFLKHTYPDTDSTFEPIIEKIKGMWTTLSESNQKVIWDYITALVGLAKKCVA
jgi:hypothetical protein